MQPITVIGLRFIPNVERGSQLGRTIVEAARKQHVDLRSGDVLVVAQKIVSKSEGRVVFLSKIKPSKNAVRFARRAGKDPRLVEVILGETRRIVRRRGSHLIVETRHGLVCANAGVDRSNVEGQDTATLLPKDPDWSAQQIRAEIMKLTKKKIAVIVSDTFGRPWRMGQTNVAIGASGMRPWIDYRGKKDMFGHKLSATVMAVGDELAGAAELVMNKDARIPVALIRGYTLSRGRGSARELIRPAKQDLFR